AAIAAVAAHAPRAKRLRETMRFTPVRSIGEVYLPPEAPAKTSSPAALDAQRLSGLRRREAAPNEPDELAHETRRIAVPERKDDRYGRDRLAVERPERDTRRQQRL